MDAKLEFILKQISKTNKKNCENYVVTRIYNCLNDLDIKFITQQYVSRGNGQYALTDMYFPQLDLHIEIDEPHHKHNIDADKMREEDIVNLTNHTVMRVDFTKGIKEIHDKIDEIVRYIKNKKIELKDTFIPWDIENETNPKLYIERGYIDTKDNVAFRTITDGCNCFGLNYKGYQRGGAKHPIEKDTLLWFPKLFVNDRYSNKLSKDGKFIYESSNNKEATIEEIINRISNNNFRNRRIVFAKVIGPLGDIMYRFKGEFKLNYDESLRNKCLAWEKISDRVRTYKCIEMKEK